jgi:Family of unknown function (DUF5946)
VRQGSETLQHCVGCGALVPAIDGPTHPYIGASPGCWAIYGEVLAKEYGEYGYPAVHRLTVDAYAAQHPGVPGRRSIQSVAVHLISLHLILERGYGPEKAAAAIRKALDTRRQEFVWLDPPDSPGAVTVLDVLEARDLAEHTERVMEWAASVWEAWEPHHHTVRRWANR